MTISVCTCGVDPLLILIVKCVWVLVVVKVCSLHCVQILEFLMIYKYIEII